jgi:hypothetical protein
MRNLIFIIALLIFESCLREEKPLTPHTPGNIETVTISIGYPYLNQVYYDCKTNTIIQSNTKYDWDIAFESSPDGYHILLNNALGMLAADLGDKPISYIPDISTITWTWDNPNGNLDSTAIGDWRGKNSLFLIHRQYDDEGNFIGYEKLKVTYVDESHYAVSFCPKDSVNAITLIIPKLSDKNFVYLSFSDGGKILDLEPPRKSWDLLFTNHHHKFDNLSLPFVLTQVLTNTYNGVIVAEDNDGKFTSITLQDTLQYSFTNIWDEIGYDWKIRNSNDNSFTIDPNKSYIVKATDGTYYKIRFIDFYNNEGQKGYPKFEIQRL